MRNSAAFRALRPVQRHELIHEMVRVATYIAAGERGDRAPAMAVILDGRSAQTEASTSGASRLPAPDSAGKRVDSSDFHTFAADLIHGIFGAIVTATQEQMEAYAALMKRLSRSVEDMSNHRAAAQDASLTPQTRERIALDRQQQLATTVLAGTRRIVDAQGTLFARVVFDAA